MIKFNKQIFELMLEANQLNNPLSPLWILRSEKVYHKGKYFLKTYVHQNETLLSELKGVVFVLNYSGKITKLESYEFKKVDSYNDENIFGCLLEFPNDYDGFDYTINISSIFLNNVERTIDLSKVELIHLDQLQQESAKNDFLKTQIEFYELFPTFNYKYWHCYCGKVNELTSENCTNCSTSKELVTKIFDKGIDNEFLDRYLSINPYKIDSAFDKQTNIDKFVEKLSTFDISAEQLLETIEAFDYASIYLHTYPIKLDTKKSADDNFRNYIAILGKYGIDQQEIENILNVEDIEKRINDQKLAESKTRKKKKTFIVATTLIVSITLFMYFVGFDLIKYGIAYYNYSNKNYDASIVGFQENEGFLDSSNLLQDSYYLKALKEYDTRPTESIDLLYQLSLEKYKDSSDLFDEYTYIYADSKFISTDYDVSIMYFTKIPTYKDSSVKIDMANYQLGLSFFEQKSFLTASDYMAKASVHNYLDSAILNKEYRYLYAKSLMSSVSYDNAKLILSGIGDYKDAITLGKECTYQIALTYYNVMAYANAIAQFETIKGYKDVNAKITTAEGILYGWKITDGAVTDYKPSDYPNTHMSVVGKYAQYYYYSYFIVGGKPGSNLQVRFQFNYPGGSVSDDETIEATSGYYSYYGRGYEGSGAPSGSYSIKVYFKINGVWKLMDTKQFRVY